MVKLKDTNTKTTWGLTMVGGARYRHLDGLVFLIRKTLSVIGSIKV